MNDASVDEIGIRNTAPNLVYTNGVLSSWIDSGILNKPISDFGDFRLSNEEFFPSGHINVDDHGNVIYSTSPSYLGDIRINIRRSVIPEPEEYALVFSLFALGFCSGSQAFPKENDIKK